MADRSSVLQDPKKELQSDADGNEDDATLPDTQSKSPENGARTKAPPQADNPTSNTTAASSPPPPERHAPERTVSAPSQRSQWNIAETQQSTAEPSADRGTSHRPQQHSPPLPPLSPTTQTRKAGGEALAQVMQSVKGIPNDNSSVAQPQLNPTTQQQQQSTGPQPQPRPLQATDDPGTPLRQDVPSNNEAPVGSIPGPANETVVKKGRFTLIKEKSAAGPSQSASSSQTNSGTAEAAVGKKKGRFTLLQEHPLSSSKDLSLDGAPSTPAPPSNVQPNRERATSTASVKSTASGNAQSETNAAPVVKKKGRFVLSSLDGQESSASTSTAAVSSAPGPSTGSAQAAMVAPQSASLQPLHAVLSSQTGAVPFVQERIQPGAQDGGQVHTYGVSPAVLVAPHGHIPAHPVVYAAARIPVATQTEVQGSSGQPMPATPIDTAAVASAERQPPKESSQQGQQQQHQPPMQHPTARRPVPKGATGRQGLGKVLYFLDQMRSEVIDADRTIKSMQADIKHLKEKNKELEAKARDAERKLVEEKSLRESAEAELASLAKQSERLVGNTQTPKKSQESRLMKKLPSQESLEMESLLLRQGSDTQSDTVDMNSSLNEIRERRMSSDKMETIDIPFDPTADAVIVSTGAGPRSRLQESQSTRRRDTGTTPPRDEGHRRVKSSSPTPMESTVIVSNRNTVDSEAHRSTVSHSAYETGRSFSAGNSPMGPRDNGELISTYRSIPSLPGSNASVDSGSVVYARGHLGDRCSSTEKLPSATTGQGSINAANDFDPLKPTSENASLKGDVSGAVQVLAPTPVVMVNQQMAVPIVGLAASRSDDLTDTDVSSQQIEQGAHQRSSSLPAMRSLQQPSLADLSIGSSGSFPDIQPLLLVSQVGGVQHTQPMVALGQPFVHLHETNYNPAELNQVDAYAQPSGHAASDTNPPRTGGDQTSDPFDEIVRRSSSKKPTD